MRVIKIWIGVLCLALMGCGPPVQETITSSNPALKVDILGDVDGCRIYQFEGEGSRMVYFVNCGRTTTINQSYRVGKVWNSTAVVVANGRD